MNVVDPILNFGKTQCSAPALIEGDRTITYGALAELVRRTASHLVALGFKRGDRIGLCLKDSADHLIALLGAAYMGGVAVTLDWRARANENARLIDGLGIQRVLTETNTRLRDHCTVITIDDAWRHAVALTQACGQSPCDGHDPFVVSATSGSTGVPRFTLMTHRQYNFAIAGMLELMALAGPHRFLCTLPLYYSGGRNSCIAHLLRGDCIVLYPSLFTPVEYLEVVNRQRITVGTVVPSVVRQFLAAEGPEPMLPGLTKLFCTGAPLYTEEKRQAVRKLTPNFYERYGTAETLALSVLCPVDLADRADSVGRPHSQVQIEIVDENNQPMDTGAVGRLRIRGPGLASPLPEQMKDSSFHDGWFYPGEIARLNENGYIFLRGRVSDVIMRSGAKIYPLEVERTLIEHQDILEAAVLGHRVTGNEEAVIAFVVKRGNMTTGELLAHCRARLTPHKVPQQITFVAELPRNTSGKVDKFALAKLADKNMGS